MKRSLEKVEVSLPDMPLRNDTPRRAGRRSFLGVNPVAETQKEVRGHVVQHWGSTASKKKSPKGRLASRKQPHRVEKHAERWMEVAEISKVHRVPLTNEELALARERFQTMDVDGSASIDEGELRTVLRSMGQDPSETELRAMIAEVDEDGNGTIEMREFVQLLETMKCAPGMTDDEFCAQNLMYEIEEGSTKEYVTRTVGDNFGVTVPQDQLDDMVRAGLKPYICGKNTPKS